MRHMIKENTNCPAWISHVRYSDEGIEYPAILELLTRASANLQRFQKSLVSTMSASQDIQVNKAKAPASITDYSSWFFELS